MAVSTIPAPTYIFKEYKGPAATISAGTIGTHIDGDYTGVSITGYKAIGAMIGYHNHPGSYTPKVMISSNRLYRSYTRVVATQVAIAAEDWSAIVLYEKI